ncbi:unnamed protein product [Meganyctiphanes norvegica]|uniref:Uncharacterized protein n=1 Tax=Meganyctiphanes norvegica TaxID=48144 RepID=A0AAV2RKT1_MEGNR
MIPTFKASQHIIKVTHCQCTARFCTVKVTAQICSIVFCSEIFTSTFQLENSCVCFKYELLFFAYLTSKYKRLFFSLDSGPEFMKSCISFEEVNGPGISCCFRIAKSFIFLFSRVRFNASLAVKPFTSNSLILTDHSCINNAISSFCFLNCLKSLFLFIKSYDFFSIMFLEQVSRCFLPRIFSS